MTSNDASQNEKRRSHRRILPFDLPVIIFILIGWLLIFAMATLGLRRDTQRWLPVNLAAQVSADYSVEQDGRKSAPLQRGILDEVDHDNQAEKSNPPPPLMLASNREIVPAVTPTPTPTPRVLVISAGGPYQGDEGSEIILIGQGPSSTRTRPIRNITYAWDLNNDGVYDDAKGLVANVIFTDEGEYPVSLQADNGRGGKVTDSALVVVSNVAPVINVQPDFFTDEAEEIELFVEAVDPGNDILFYQWDLGDGDFSEGSARPTHTYEDDGDYEVHVRVSDNDNGQAEAFFMVHVLNVAPSVDAGSDQVTDEGSQITLSGLADDPAGTDDPLTYFWDFDFDGQSFNPQALGRTVTHIYPDGPANVEAALLVDDGDEDGQTIDTINITVNNVAPVIGGAANDGPKGEGQITTLEVTATDVGSDTLSYAFDWQDDGNFEEISQASVASHRWFNEGDYRVGIRVDDGDGGQDSITTTVSYFNLPPLAVAQVSWPGPGIATEGDTLTFDGSDSSDPGINDVLTYNWNFGDGQSGSGRITPHTYADNGVYSATLTVRDDAVNPGSDTDAVAVTVGNANPVAAINEPTTQPQYEIVEGVDLTLNFRGSAEDAGENDTLTFAWDLNYDGAFTQDQTGASFSKFYPELVEPGDFEVALRVRDDDYPAPIGEIGEDLVTLKIKIINMPPQNVDAGGPYNGVEGQPVTLTGSADDIPGDPLEYKWDLDGDGNSDKTGQTITHTWNTFGIYPITLRVSDGTDEESDSTTVDINAIPIAAAQANPTQALEGSPITFDGSNSIDPDNDTLTYQWNFGDGSAASGQIITHPYPDNGAYIATLTVTDEDLFSATDSVTVTIFNANPAANAGPDRVADEGVQFSVTGSAVDPGSADILTYAWDFNYDGVTFNQTDTGPTVPKTYLDGPALFTVALRVRDDDYNPSPPPGHQIGEDIDTLLVTVNNVPPIVTTDGPFAGVEGQPVTLTGDGSDVMLDLPLAYAWDLDNDGAPDKTGQTVTYTWPVGGLYTVVLSATDKDGGTGFSLPATVDIDSIPTVLTGGPYNGPEGSLIQLTGSGSDPDGDPVTFAWDLDNDGTFETPGQSVPFTRTDDGLYSIALRVDDGRGGVATANTTVTVTNVAPTANAGGPYNGDEGLPIFFDGSGSSDPGNDIATYNWDFGDGTTGSGITPGHAYADDGPYTITLTVTDDDGATSAPASASVIVNNVAPTADAGGPYRTTINVSTVLTGSGNDVPGDPLTYTWDLDNDGTFEKSGQSVTNIWTTPGIKTVVLRVEDDDSGAGIATTTVDVGSPPTANASGPYTVSEGSSISLTGSGIDPDGDPVTFAWDLDNDGTFETPGQSVPFSKIDDGLYTVILQVQDDRGGIATASTTVTVTNVAPTANAGGPYSGDEGLPIFFDGSGSGDPGNDIAAHNWDFGDGAIGSGVTPNHSYDDDGIYTVTLTVTDDDGAASAPASASVIVNNVAPTANAGGPYTTTVGITITLTGSGIDVPGDPLTYTWDLDDDGLFETSGQSVTFSAAVSGTFTVTLQVADGDGGRTTDSTTVQVQSLLPVLWLGSGSYLVLRRRRISPPKEGQTD